MYYDETAKDLIRLADEIRTSRTDGGLTSTQSGDIIQYISDVAKNSEFVITHAMSFHVEALLNYLAVQCRQKAKNE